MEEASLELTRQIPRITLVAPAEICSALHRFTISPLHRFTISLAVRMPQPLLAAVLQGSCPAQAQSNPLFLFLSVVRKPAKMPLA
jgi:hypothetical protein